MAAIVYFEKSLEDTERVTYRDGTDEQDFANSLVINNVDQLPVNRLRVRWVGTATGSRRPGRPVRR